MDSINVGKFDYITEELASKCPKNKEPTSENGPNFAQNPKLKTNSYQSSTPKRKSKSSVPLQQQSEETFSEKLSKVHCLPDLLRKHSVIFCQVFRLNRGLEDLKNPQFISKVGSKHNKPERSPSVDIQVLEDKCWTRKNKHLALLARGALFFGMILCKYLKTKNTGKKMKLFCIKNFRNHGGKHKNERQNTQHIKGRLRSNHIRITEIRFQTKTHSTA